MRIVLFLDLDDTIFQTRSKCPPGEPVRPAAFGRDGAPLSFMTQRQHTLLNVLFRAATVIPTTARNFDAFRRVDLPFAHGAILNFGGVVVRPDGTLDPAWDAQVRPQLTALGAELHAIKRSIETIIARRQLGASARLIVDFDLPLYVVVKHPAGDADKLLPLRDELRASLDHDRFFLHCNDNNLSVAPRCLGKERAVRYVIDHVLGDEPALTIGMGDSLTDAAFLDLCDYSLVPGASQLAAMRSRIPEGRDV
jgi:hypothetical protein